MCSQVVAGVCQSVVYGLMSFVLDQFHAETLGSDSQVSQLGPHYTRVHVLRFIRSTPKSRPNNMGLRCPSVCPSVRPSTKSFADSDEI